jgi:outer membrane protein assembly factor BamB
VYSSPTVSNGVVYVGSFDGNVYAIAANAGTLKWSFTAAPSSTTPYAGQSFTIEGTLASGNGGMPDAPLTLYRAAVNEPFGLLLWTKVATTRTASGVNAGVHSFPVTENTVQTVRYRVVYDGSATLNGATAYTSVNVVQQQPSA